MAVIGNAPFQGLVSGGNIIDASIEGVDLSTSAIAARLGYTPVDPGAATFTANVTINDDSANAALRITQTGAGNALLVEDSTNPDATPFVIDASGNVIVGGTTPITGAQSYIPPLQVSTGNTNNSGVGVNAFSAGSGSGYLHFNRSKSSTVGTNTLVTSGDTIGNIVFAGADGTGFIRAAIIQSIVDGTPGTNDMPGRLVFSTTADGASSPTERMRISSTGQTTFSYNAIISVTDNTNAALRITQLGTGNALLVEDSANPDSTPFVIDASGNTVVGSTAPIATVSFAGGAITPLFQVQGTGLNSSSAGVSNWSGTAASASSFVFSKSNSGTIGTRGAVASGTNLGSINFAGDDGTNFVPAASILAVVDGTTGMWDMPGRLVFNTTADGDSVPTERMRIDSSGRLLIGTTTQSQTGNLLEVNKSQAGGTIAHIVNTSTSTSYAEANLSLSAYNTGIMLGSVGANVTTYGIATIAGLAPAGTSYLMQFSSYPMAINHYAAQPIVFGTNNAERMRIGSNGNVSIGTTSTSYYRLQVSGIADTTFTNSPASMMLVNTGTIAAGLGTGINFSMNYDGSGTTTYAQISAIRENATVSNCQGALVFGTRDSSGGVAIERMRIDSGGNIGIGTTSPFGTASGRTAFSVNGSSTVTLNIGTGGTQRGYLYSDGTLTQVGSYGAIPLIFATNDTERARINSSGNLLVGTTSIYNSAKVSVAGDLEARGSIKSYQSGRGGLASGASVVVLSVPNGYYGAEVSVIIYISQREDGSGNLSNATYNITAFGSGTVAVTPLGSASYGGGKSFSLTTASGGGGFTVTLNNTAGGAASTALFMAANVLVGYGAITWGW